MTKKITENDEDVIIATEANKKMKFGRKIVEDEDESDEDDEDESDEDESDEDESDDDETDVKTSIKESTDHIIGIVSSKKFHLLEDSIMGVVKSKIRERIDEEKAQIKARLAFKGA